MAVNQIQGEAYYIGLSTDVKPAGVAVGSRFLAYDTDALYVTYDGTNWAQVASEAGGATVKRAIGNVAAGGTDTALVAAVAGKKIRVLAAMIVGAGTATVVTFTSKPAGAGTAISPALAVGVNGVVPLPYNPVGWLETVAAEGLSVTTGAGTTTGILVVYVEV